MLKLNIYDDMVRRRQISKLYENGDSPRLIADTFHITNRRVEHIIKELPERDLVVMLSSRFTQRRAAAAAMSTAIWASTPIAEALEPIGVAAAGVTIQRGWTQKQWRQCSWKQGCRPRRRPDARNGTTTHSFELYDD